MQHVVDREEPDGRGAVASAAYANIPQGQPGAALSRMVIAGRAGDVVEQRPETTGGNRGSLGVVNGFDLFEVELPAGENSKISRIMCNARKRIAYSSEHHDAGICLA